MRRVIEITVSPAGQTQVRTQGFVGRSCQEASRVLEAALGQRESERLTGEFYQSATEIQNETEETQ